MKTRISFYGRGIGAIGVKYLISIDIELNEEEILYIQNNDPSISVIKTIHNSGYECPSEIRIGDKISDIEWILNIFRDAGVPRCQF